jgi:hypothetical protein
MPLRQFFNYHRQKHTAYHNLCTTLQPPPQTHKLLWMGLKFCIERPLPKPPIAESLERFQYNVRIKALMANTDDGDSDYDPKLYIPSIGYEPPKATPELEQALQDFGTALTNRIQANHQRRRHNLPASTRAIIKQIGLDNTKFIVTLTDKNLGPAILERATYKQRCLTDHLLDATTYRQLTPLEAKSKVQTAWHQMSSIIHAFRHYLEDREQTYFKRALQLECRLPQFYITPKVHKTPWKTRPIVSCVHSTLGYLSKWIDRQLQKVVHLCPGYLRDSADLLQKLQQMDPLSATTVIFVADAVSMYTNIDTTHNIETLKAWLKLHKAELPPGFPISMIIAATELVMTYNVFQFGDTYWLQQTGTAMGTPVAVTLATIYFAYHEETSYLKKYHISYQPDAIRKAASPLLFYARLIDDTIQMWDTAKLPNHIHPNMLPKQIEADMLFGKLPWEVNPPARAVNFLDLHISICQDGGITTRTFIKPMNLHLYIPPASAHSPGVLKSLIFGNVFRYWLQNSQKSDFVQVTRDFYVHLLNRGYRPDVLTPIFRSAAELITKRDQQQRPTGKNGRKAAKKQLFLHWEYHPRDITRQDIRSVYNSILAPILEAPPLGVQRLTVAYRNPPNLRRLLTRTQLRDLDGDQVSSYVANLTQQQP